MTPEQRADSIVDWGERLGLRQIFIDAIREAVKEEREACAEIAERSGIYGHMVSQSTARGIAGTIRARSPQETTK